MSHLEKSWQLPENNKVTISDYATNMCNTEEFYVRFYIFTAVTMKGWM